jgi:hypothetical protein
MRSKLTRIVADVTVREVTRHLAGPAMIAALVLAVATGALASLCVA